VTTVSALLANLPNYEDRPGQRQVARAVEDALSQGSPLFVEAGTGTGKTLAYLLPIIESNQPVIVSTATRALQEQIANHDLPLAAELTGKTVSFAVVKGVSNYVCRRRWSQYELKTLPTAKARERDEVRAWLKTSAGGDRAELPTLPPDAPIWSDITTEADGRLGTACPFYESCLVRQARKKAENAQIVVVNHNLFLADLALKNGSSDGILPPYGAVVFDEAHQLEDHIASHFGVTVSHGRLRAVLRDAATILGGEEAVPAVERCRGPASQFFATVRALLEQEDTQSGRVALSRNTLRAGADEQWLDLDSALESLERNATDNAKVRDPNVDASARLASRVRRLRDDIARVVEQDDRSTVFWGELPRGDTVLRGALIDASRVLSGHLFPLTETVIFTSATLSVGGDFAFSKQGLGLDTDEVSELSVPSPFQYQEQAHLYLPRDLPIPSDPGFGDAANTRIAELIGITGGRALVLYTSHRALRLGQERLSKTIDYPLLVQGQAPPNTLVTRFRERPSVLLATGTFWEGLDIPGDALSLVIMDKVPFASPGDPPVRARLQALEEAGLDPFAAFQVPAAALALKQGFGRLIRRRSDRGIAAILDVRLLSKQYGRVLLDALPSELPRTASLERIRRFWNALP